MRWLPAAILVPLLAFTACAPAEDADKKPDEKPSPADTIEIQNGSVNQAKLPSGLACDVYRDYSVTGLDCNWDAFTAPDRWETKTGGIEKASTDWGYLELSRYADGHMCVTVNYYDSGALTCSYPAR